MIKESTYGPTFVAYLVGPPGAGKTKTIFDLSRSQYTLYFDCSPEGETPSEDLVECIAVLKYLPATVLQEVDYAKNEDSSWLFSLLLLARLLYLEELITKYEVTPETWLLVQTTYTQHSNNLRELFRFLIFATSYYATWKDDVSMMISTLGKNISEKKLSTLEQGKLVVCLDEAQSLFSQFRGIISLIHSHHITVCVE